MPQKLPSESEVEELYRLPVLRLKENGDYVRRLQTQLNFLGYLLSTDISSFFDAATEEAVCKFQSDRGLRADGIVGTLTWQQLLVSIGEANRKG